MESAPRSIVFFDVDDTLLTVGSMLRFLAYHWEREGLDPDRFARARAELHRRREAGARRGELNRLYYRHFRGCDSVDLAEAGRDWYAAEVARGDFFHAPVVDALRSHRRAGRHIALVSGSFPPCLDPIAEELGADLVLCTTPRVDAGVLTGEIGVPVIGPEKAARARRAMTAYGVAAADCYAYGDHASDLELLLAVGHPVVVGDDPVLADRAAREGWLRLPAAAARSVSAARPASAAGSVSAARPVSTAQPASAARSVSAARPASPARSASVAQPASAARSALVAQPLSAARPTSVAQPASAARSALVAQPLSAARPTSVVQPTSAPRPASAAQPASAG
ncbi:HAD-IB family hydrolase [Streptomyces sp. NPDC058476]|uniref:HAD family hydrolase n=1 Tax=Streptomyces sp. NPDC058476 TaxID=3346519 RepID=UPI00365EC505